MYMTLIILNVIALIIMIVTQKEDKKDMVKVKDIKIPYWFKKSGVKKNKFTRKEEYFIKNKCFEDNIILNKNGKLLDGYSAYLLAKKYNIQNVEVLRDKKY